MKKLILSVSALALTAGLAGQAVSQDQEGQVTAWRLFVSDHEKPVVYAIDALDGDLLATFDIKGPASLYRGESGEAVYAVQGDADTINVIQTGIAFHDHGDHADIDVDDPALGKAEFTGDYPVHFVEHDGYWAAFFDKEGVARVFDEHEALEGHVEMREVASGAPHHGVAVAYGNFDLVSAPNPDDADALPIGIRMLDQNGKQVGELAACPDLHGEASSGDVLAFACATGLLVVRGDGASAPTIEHLAYADTLPEGKSTTLIGGRGLQYFLGNYGADKVVLIDPSEAESFRIVQLPTRRVHFAVDPIRSRFAYVFTEDGQLHQLDVLAGEITKSIKLTEPYSIDGDWNDPRPRIAVAGDHVVVTDPQAGKLHLVKAVDLTADGDIAIDGKPFNIVALGGTGAPHSDEGHDHDNHAHDDQVYKGYFEDSQIAERTLADWGGDWQSVYPLLLDGNLDRVMAHEAESGDKTADEYRAYYNVGYKTDVDRITIEGDDVTFYEDGKPISATYQADGYEILTYEKGNRGVRFIFAKTAGDDAAPQFIQFSDHAIAPQDAGHYHLYWGDDRAALLEELTNWPTYYPSELSADQVVKEMLAH